MEDEKSVVPASDFLYPTHELRLGRGSARNLPASAWAKCNLCRKQARAQELQFRV